MEFIFNWQVWFCNMALWVLVYLFNLKGIKSMMYLVNFSIPLSMLFVFFIHLFGVTLG